MIPAWTLPAVVVVTWAVARWWHGRRRERAEARARLLVASANRQARRATEFAETLTRTLAAIQAVRAPEVAGSDLPPRGQGLPEVTQVLPLTVPVSGSAADEDLTTVLPALPASSGQGEKKHRDSDDAPAGGGGMLTASIPPVHHRHRYPWPAEPAAVKTWARGVWHRARQTARRLVHRPTVRVRRIHPRDRSPWDGWWHAILPPERQLAAAAQARTRFRHATGGRGVGRWTPEAVQQLRAALPTPPRSHRRRRS